MGWLCWRVSLTHFFCSFLSQAHLGTSKVMLLIAKPCVHVGGWWTSQHQLFLLALYRCDKQSSFSVVKVLDIDDDVFCYFSVSFYIKKWKKTRERVLLLMRGFLVPLGPPPPPHEVLKCFLLLFSVSTTPFKRLFLSYSLSLPWSLPARPGYFNNMSQIHTLKLIILFWMNLRNIQETFV